MKCLNCGSEFSKRAANQLYCCRKCGDEYRKEHNINILYPSLSFNCSECGHMVVTEYGYKDKRTRFCSRECERKFWKHPHWENPSTRINFNSIDEYEKYEKRTNEE